MKNKTMLIPLLSALLLPVAACGTTVLGGGGGGEPDKGAPDSTSTATTTPGVTATGAGGAGTSPGIGGAETTTVTVSVSSSASTGGASAGGQPPISGPGIAILYDNLPPAPTVPPLDQASYVCQGGVTGALVLFWSSLGESCSAPFIVGSASGTDWQGILVLPPEALQVGPVDLSTGQVMSCTWEFLDQQTGGGGGGPLTQGTIDIVAIDDVSITLNFVTPYELTSGFTGNGVTYPPITLQGTYTVPRC